MYSRCIAILAVIGLVVGCGSHRWDNESAPNIGGTNAMVAVSAFIATNGWNMCTNEDYLANWDNLRPRQICGLPWSKYENKQFWAMTCNGILYVLSDPGWHGDYAGVAYNPMTNQFSASIAGFKPIGNHWYVWCTLELPGGSNLPKEYEK